MSAPPHHFMQNINNANQTTMGRTFGPGPMGQMGQSSMTNQNQMGNQMGNTISGTTMGTPMGMGQMSTPLSGGMSPMGGTQINTTLNAGLNSGPAMGMGQMNQQFNINSPMTGNMTTTITPAINTTNQMIPSTTMPNTTMPNQMQQRQPQTQAQTQSQMEFTQTPSLNSQEIVPTSTATSTPPAATPQQQQQSKEFNTASLCRLGQETVQDIVSRTQEVFQTLKVIQPPAGTLQSSNASIDKKAKVQELLRTIRVLFKRLRLVYEKCNENCHIQGMEYTHIESLIPYRDEIDPKHEERKNSEAYKLSIEESREVMEQVIAKNKQLKEVIDHLRRIVWEINTMLTMRKS